MSLSNQSPDKIRSAFAPMRPSVPLPHKPVERTAEAASGHNTLGQPEAAQGVPEPPTALYDISITVQVVAELPKGEPALIRSRLGANNERIIALQLNSAHLIVSRSLRRADTLVVRFLLCLALAEYVGFWSRKRDGQSLRAAITAQAKIEPERLWGLTLANELAASELVRALDTTRIFGPTPSDRVHELFKLSGVRLRVKSDLPNWRPKQEL